MNWKETKKGIQNKKNPQLTCRHDPTSTNKTKQEVIMLYKATREHLPIAMNPRKKSCENANPSHKNSLKQE